MRSNNNDTLLELVGMAHGACLNDMGWDPLLRRLADITGSVAAGITVEHPNTRKGRPITYFGFDSDHVQKTFDYYLPMNPLFDISHQMKTGFIVANGDVVATRDFVKTEFYNGWARPQGLCSPLTLILDHGPDYYCPLTLVRPDGKGEASLSDKELLRRLSPHLNRAMKTYLRLQAADVRIHAAESILDASDHAIFMLDQTGKIISANQCARRMLSTQDIIGVRGERLRACEIGNDILLQRALAQAQYVASPSAAECQLKRNSLLPVSVSVVPISPLDQGFNLPNMVNRQSVVIMTDPETKRRSTFNEKARDFDLSPAEMRVLSILLEGSSINVAVNKLGVTPNTVRTHLKRIFHKTRTSRQAELVHLFLR